MKSLQNSGMQPQDAQDLFPKASPTRGMPGFWPSCAGPCIGSSSQPAGLAYSWGK